MPPMLNTNTHFSFLIINSYTYEIVKFCSHIKSLNETWSRLEINWHVYQEKIKPTNTYIQIGHSITVADAKKKWKNLACGLINRQTISLENGIFAKALCSQFTIWMGQKLIKIRKETLTERANDVNLYIIHFIHSD